MSLAKRVKFLIYCVKQLPFVFYSTFHYFILSSFRDAKTKQELADLSLRIHLVTQVIKKSTGDVDTVTLEQTQALLGGRQSPRKHEIAVPVMITSQRQMEIEAMVDAAVLGTCPEGIDKQRLPKSVYAECKAEWQGTRFNDTDTYEGYLDGCQNKNSVLLYFHGGGFMFGTEEGHRSLVARLQKRFHGRALSVRYRLSPQNQFPSALTDALAAYLYLLHPPADAVHQAVPASQIVLGGDSAGGNLAIALYTLLVQQKQPIPAGLVLISPWLDLTHSFPSCRTKEHDYLPPMYPRDAGTLLKQHRDSPSWPLQGRTRQVYTSDELLLHPLVSPVLVPELWKRLQASPRLCIQVGSQEVLLDENRDFARALTGVSDCLLYDEYKSMPHVFQVFGGQHQSAVVSLEIMANFIKRATLGQASGSALFMRALPDEKESLYHDTTLLSVRSQEEKQQQMRAAIVEAEAHRHRMLDHKIRQARL